MTRTAENKDEKRRKAEAIISRLKQAGFESYFVGGCVRDFVRGVVPGDYDIVTSALPDQVKVLFERTVAVGAKFGVMVVIQDGHSYEVATFRSDDVYEDGRRPTRVHFSSAKEDVLRRDFTINGLLMDPETNQIIDYVDGLADIDRKVIRTIGDPAVRFNEDYLRMLRAIRFTANLGFAMDPATRNAIEVHAANIKRISAERIAEELNKMLTRGGARPGFELMVETGILQQILPEVNRMRGVGATASVSSGRRRLATYDDHAGSVTRMKPACLSTRRWPGARFCMMSANPCRALRMKPGVHFYGHVKLGEAIADDILQRLRFSRAQRETVISLVHHHMVFMNVQKMRPARLKRFLRMPDFHLHLQLHRLDCLASHGMLDHYDFCRRQLQNLEQEELHPPRLLTGDDLLTMGFTPGKLIGEILRALEEEQLENRVHSQEEALAFVQIRWKP